MEISWKSLCSDVMVLRAVVTGTGKDPPDRNVTFFSFVAFDKSIEAADKFPG